MWQNYEVHFHRHHLGKFRNPKIVWSEDEVEEDEEPISQPIEEVVVKIEPIDEPLIDEEPLID